MYPFGSTQTIKINEFSKGSNWTYKLCVLYIEKRNNYDKFNVSFDEFY